MPSKSRRTNRCTIYDDGDGKRCRRSGRGDPAMCEMHRDEIGVPSAFGQVIDAILHGRAPSKNAVHDAAFDVAEAFMGRRLTPEERARARAMGGTFGGGPSPSSGSRSSSDSGDSDASSSSRDEARQREAAEREIAKKIGAARRTLGFSAKEPITPEILKAKHRTLVRKWHPDQYARDPAKYKAATSRMAEINAAVEVLTKPL